MRDFEFRASTAQTRRSSVLVLLFAGQRSGEVFFIREK
jgi:hypothetical protein